MVKGAVDPRIADSSPGVEMAVNVLALAMHEEKRRLMMEEQFGEEIDDFDVSAPDTRVRGPIPGVPFELRVELRAPLTLRTCRIRVLTTDTDFVIKGRVARHLNEDTHACFVETAASEMVPGQTVGELGLEANSLLTLYRDVPPYVGRLPWDAKQLLHGTASSGTASRSTDERVMALLSDF